MWIFFGFRLLEGVVSPRNHTRRYARSTSTIIIRRLLRFVFTIFGKFNKSDRPHSGFLPYEYLFSYTTRVPCIQFSDVPIIIIRYIRARQKKKKIVHLRHVRCKAISIVRLLCTQQWRRLAVDTCCLPNR